MSELEVIVAGWATTVQDAGRPGYAAIGVPISGALDAPLRELVNRLVGNPDDAAVLETAGGLRIRTDRPCVVATSAELAARAVAAGETIEVEPAEGSMWGYFAARGGIVVEPVLGSRSQDSRSGLGPPSIAHGARLPIGPDPGSPIVVDQAPPAPRPAIVPVWPGPRLDWFDVRALDHLTATAWTVSAEVSRVGVRLDGPPVARRIHDELPSEGVVTGAIQVPADGRPVVMLADHPTTGGYPVIAIVDPAALAVVVQSRPGTVVRFRVLR